MAEPVFPPTWKNDCANPCCPPEASRAIREDSGWKTADPVPTTAAASSNRPKVGATASSPVPASVKHIPTASAYGIGLRSVYSPMNGCRRLATTWYTSEISPICPKFR